LGGAILKMADETAAMAASKHALDGIGVTASMDAVNFNHTIPKGKLICSMMSVSFMLC
jgi:acyl-CoA hydrolase